VITVCVGTQGTAWRIVDRQRKHLEVFAAPRCSTAARLPTCEPAIPHLAEFNTPSCGSVRTQRPTKEYSWTLIDFAGAPTVADASRQNRSARACTVSSNFNTRAHVSYPSCSLILYTSTVYEYMSALLRGRNRGTALQKPQCPEIDPLDAD
jgi:hypothetical protein